MSKEKYGISIVMSEAIPVLLEEGQDESIFDYVAEFNYISSDNGNGNGIVNILKSGLPVSIQYGEWSIFPAINFGFSWTGQSYTYKASYKEDEPMKILVANPSGVSAFKRSDNANLGDLRAIFSSFKDLSSYQSSMHYKIVQDLRAYKSDLKRSCPPYRYKLNERQYEDVISKHKSFLERMKESIIPLDSEKDIVKEEILMQLSEINELLASLPPVDLSCNTIISDINKKL